MDLKAIANSTFNSENSVNGFHTLKLTEGEHKSLKDALGEHLKIKNFNNISIVEAERRLKVLKEEQLKLLSPTTEVKPSEVAQLKAEIEELKKADEYSMSLCEIQNEKFMDQLEGKDEEIADLKNKLAETEHARIKYFNERSILKEYVKSQIDHKLTHDIHNDYNGQVDITTYGYMSEFNREKFHVLVDECIDEMTTYESNGCGAYRNGYWYDKNLGEYELQHKGGCIVWDYKASDEENSDED